MVNKVKMLKDTISRNVGNSSEDDQVSRLSCPLWPALSPDLTPCNYYLWQCFKDNIHKKTHAQKHDDHKDTILCAVSKISWQELQTILSNMFTRCQAYLGYVGHNCQQLLQNAVSNIQLIYFNAASIRRSCMAFNILHF
jgi:hypothetical protein